MTIIHQDQDQPRRRLVPSSRLQGWNKSHTVYVRIRSVHVYTASPIQVSDCERQFNIRNYEPVHDKTNKMACAQRILRSTWASAQSDQSFRCPREESLGPWLPFERTAKTLIRLGWCPGWSESLLGAQVILCVLSCGGSYMSHVPTKPAFGVWNHLRLKLACSATETTADPVFEISTSPIARH